MQHVRYPAEDAVLGDEGTSCAATEEAVDGSVVVKEQVEGGAVAEGGECESTIGSKEFGGLLGEDPGWAREEPGAHGVFPDSDIEGAPGGAGGIGKEARGRGARAGQEDVGAPRREGHGEGLEEGAGDVGAGV